MIVSVTVNERTTFEITTSFTDTSGTPMVPVTVEYRIDDVNLGQEVRPWTAITPADVAVISIYTSDTAILNNIRRYETKTVTVRAEYGNNGYITGSMDFVVKNLRFM